MMEPWVEEISPVKHDPCESCCLLLSQHIHRPVLMLQLLKALEQVKE